MRYPSTDFLLPIDSALSRPERKLSASQAGSWHQTVGSLASATRTTTGLWVEDPRNAKIDGVTTSIAFAAGSADRNKSVYLSKDDFDSLGSGSFCAVVSRERGSR